MAGPSVAMLVVAALVAAAVPPLAPKAASASAQAFANFDYTMPDRYVDSNGDGLYPDPLSHVECTDPNDASSCTTIPPTLDMQPAEGWRIDLDACASTPGPDEATYNWSFADTGEPLNVLPGDEPCKFVTYFPDEGSYNIELFIVKPGESSTRIETVRVQDWLIVSMGDSLGAGEGSPNRNAEGGGEPLWQDRRCHRSSQAGSAKAAQMLEELDPRTSVTFVHTACSGARTMEGLLEPYAGVDRLLGEKYPEVTLATNGDIPMIPPQVQTAAQAVGNREIDAVYLSIGANDIHFGDLVTLCAVAEPCDAFDAAAGGLALETVVCALLTIVPVVGITCAAFALAIDAALTAALGGTWIFDTAAEVFDRGFNGDGSSDAICEDCGLDRAYDFIAEAFTRTPSSAAHPTRSQVGLGLPGIDVNRVSIAPYPDPITKPQFDENDPDSFLCGGVEDTFTMFPGISRNETRYMFNTVMPAFEDEISSKAFEHGWHFLDGVSATNLHHGYCADDRYVRRLDDVLPIQGDIQGVLHPNRAGYNVYRNVILEDWLTQMYGDGTGAGIVASNSTDETTGLAQNFLANHDPRDPAVPTADAGGPYSVNEGDTVVLDGTGTDPYGGTLTYKWALTGTPAAAQLSHATSADATLLGVDDGSGRALLTVTGSSGRTAADSANYTVHNVAPTVDAGADTTAVEGSTVSRTVLVSDPGTADTHTASVDWGDGTSSFIATAEAPSFGIQHVYADNAAYTVQVCVTDDDNGVDCDSFSVTVANAAASVSVASSAADEGSLVTLGATGFNDPGTLDTHKATVSWGDGTAVAAATVSETPTGPPGSTSGLAGTVGASHVYADNAVYTVQVCVTDDDHASGCSSGSVTIRNVSPGASITTLGEGPDFFLPGVSIPLAGALTDAGTADSHTVRVGWGDGTSSSSTTGGASVIEVPFGPPGSINGLSGTYSSAHTYAAPGVYQLTPVVTDDDGGPGSATRPVEVLSPSAASARLGDLVAALASDPIVRTAARRHLEDALRDLLGAPGSNDGADDKFRDGDLGAGMQRLTSAMSDLEAALSSDPAILGRVRFIELVITQIAESVAVDALAHARAAVPAPTPKQTGTLAQAAALLSQGRALKATNFASAVAAFRDSVGKSLSVR